MKIKESESMATLYIIRFNKVNIEWGWKWKGKIDEITKWYDVILIMWCIFEFWLFFPCFFLIFGYHDIAVDKYIFLLCWHNIHIHTYQHRALLNIVCLAIFIYLFWFHSHLNKFPSSKFQSIIFLLIIITRSGI